MMLTYFDVRPAIPFMAMKPETNFKKIVLKDLKTLDGVWTYKTSDRVKCGIPDILLCKEGRFIAIELKVDSTVTKLQQYTMDMIEKSGGRSYVATPGNWEIIFQQIKEIK